MISVIMASYNASEFIGLAIKSILEQTFSEFELIIVDDGSTDNSLEIITGYAEQDSRIRVIHAAHGGASQARNIGIEAAQYPWIAIMDADDIALPDRLEKQICLAESNPKVVAWGAAVHHISSQGKVLSISCLGPETEAEFDRMRQEGHVVNLNHPTALLKKEVVLEVGSYDPAFTSAEDLDLLDRMASHGPILATSEPLLLYRVHAQSDSMSRFFIQRLRMRYVRHRHLARLSGKADPTFEEFLAERRQWHVWRRLSKHLETLGMFYYRKAGLLVGEKQLLPACFYLGMAFVLNPTYSIPRLQSQSFFSQT
jgi:glycosyltransferase involved in cell wall biosynthesis